MKNLNAESERADAVDMLKLAVARIKLYHRECGDELPNRLREMIKSSTFDLIDLGWGR